ncbi:MAG: hypothetical protein IKW74_01620, partial [Thermoguttaceae bacterium]|nr:hypothetical protein [Thermoguttaceae bacterium]
MLDNNSASTIRKTIQHFFHQVFVRIGELANGIPEANERANVACKSLELLRWEKNIQNFVPQISGQTEIPQSQHVEQDWQIQVQTQIDRVRGLICNVNNRAEQAYLRRLLLEAVLQIDKYRQFTELVVDSLLAEIDDEEERQNAIYLCILSISSEIQNNNDLNS